MTIMIKPDDIPDDVVVALRAALEKSEYLDAAIAAALNAWPGAQDSGLTYGTASTRIYILPLPTENTND